MAKKKWSNKQRKAVMATLAAAGMIGIGIGAGRASRPISLAARRAVIRTKISGVRFQLRTIKARNLSRIRLKRLLSNRKRASRLTLRDFALGSDL